MKRVPAAALLLMAGLVPSGSGASGLSTSTSQFLKIPSGIRAASMGESFVALADDASAVNWNPAGLAQIQRGEFQLMFLKYFADINYSSAAMVLPAGDLGTLGASFIYEWVPPFNSTADPSAIKGVASDLSVSLAYAKWVHPKLGLGAAGRFVSSSLVDRVSRGGGVDFGLLSPLIHNKLHLAFAMDNVLAGNSSYSGLNIKEKLPSTVKAGILGRFRASGGIQGDLSLEYAKPLDSASYYKAGLELGYRKMYFLRAGYRMRAEGSPFDGKGHLDLGGLAGASFGAGFQTQVLAVNYAFIPMGDLGDTHRFGLSYFFAGKAMERGGAGQILEETPLAPVATQLDMTKGVVEKAEFDLGGLTQNIKTDIAEWSVDITDPTTGAVVKTYKGRGEPPTKVAWDGKDDLGGVVAGGAFANFTLRLQSMEGKEIVETHTVAAPDQLEQMKQMELRAKNRSQAQAAAPRVDMADVRPDRRGVIRIPPILFDTGSSALRKSFEPILELVGKVILENPGCKVYIEGHTDAEGSSAVAFQLSRERSNAVLRYLVEKMGVQVSSITARGHGSTAPRAMGRTEDDKTANRRVEVLIIRPKR